jgi:hypothetical protein
MRTYWQLYPAGRRAPQVSSQAGADACRALLTGCALSEGADYQIGEWGFCVGGVGGKGVGEGAGRGLCVLNNTNFHRLRSQAFQNGRAGGSADACRALLTGCGLSEGADYQIGECWARGGGGWEGDAFVGTAIAYKCQQPLIIVTRPRELCDCTVVVEECWWSVVLSQCWYAW